MRTSHIPILCVVFTISVLCAQEPAKPPTKPDATTELKGAGAPYYAAVESVSADYQKWLGGLDTWYLGELDKLTGARAKLGDLDGAVAIKAERERIAAHAATTTEQIQAMPVPLRTLRMTYEQGVKRIADEGTRRIDVARRKYLADLEALQKRITISGDIDQALLVKAEKDRFIAEMAGDAQGIAAVGPAKVAVEPVKPADVPVKPAVTSVKPAPKVPFGTRPEAGMAKVEAQNVKLTPLTPNEKLWSDRSNAWLVKIPVKFKGYQFTQTPAHAETLRFKVLTDGLVYLCCMSRWGTTAAPEVAKDFTTEEKLKAQGWAHVPGPDILGNASDHIWLIFSRPCKAGEEFAYRTDKYAPPILLVK